MKHEKIIKYLEIAAIILLLFGLGGWYLFLRNQTAAVEDASNARGFSIGIPAFLGTKGSTATNIESVLSGGGSIARGGNSDIASFSAELGMSGERLDELVSSDGRTGAATTPKPPRLIRVSATPVAGASFIASASPTLRHVERSTGHVFNTNAVTGESRRITNTLIPKVYEATLGGNDTIVGRTLEAPETIHTFVGKISTTTDAGLSSLVTRELPLPILEITSSQFTSDILMLVKSDRGTRVILTEGDGSSPKPLFALPAGDFRIVWPSSSRIILIEKPASGITGTAFTLDAALKPLMRGLGLMVLPQATSSAFLYSTDTGSAISLFARLQNGATVVIPIITVAEKCVWGLGVEGIAYCAVPDSSLGSSFTDRWYSGEVHTNDTWYRVNVSAGTAEKFYAFEGTAAIDVERAHINSSGEYLSFINARDKSLWLLRIAE